MPKHNYEFLNYGIYVAYRAVESALNIVPRKISNKIVSSLLSLYNYRGEVIKENTQKYAEAEGIPQISKKKIYDFLATQILDMSNPEKLHIDVSATDKAYIESKNTRTRIYLLGHLGRWEHAGKHIGSISSSTTYAAYQRISNRFIDRRVRALREKSNVTLLNRDVYIKNVLRNAKSNKDAHESFLVLADQRPQYKENLTHHYFLFKDAQCDPIWEKIHLNYPIDIIYISQYEKEGTLFITLKPLSKSESFWEQYLGFMSIDIRRNPSRFLWSHRRWRD